MVVGLSERRESRAVRIPRTDGLTLDCAALPLPDGATLLTSLDVTAERQCRARADRAQSGAGRRGEAAQRFRQSCLLRAAHAAHQHHRLHPIARRGRRGSAQSQAARICGLHHQFLACAARHHRRHSRSRLDRRRRAGTAARDGRCRGGDEGGGGRRAGPAERSSDRDAHRHDRRRRHAARRRAAGAPGSVQSPVQRHQLLRSRARR